MANRFREVRLQTNMSTTEVAAKAEVSPATMSHIDTGRRLPSIELLCKLADIYGVSTDYLLGRTNQSDNLIEKTVPVSAETLPVLHGSPVWIEGKGWGLVNGIARHVLLQDGVCIPFSDIQGASAFPPPFCRSIYPVTPPLLYDEICRCPKVWVEPLSADLEARAELRGWYNVYEKYVKNEFGNTFYYATYESKWLAFEKEM